MPRRIARRLPMVLLLLALAASLYSQARASYQTDYAKALEVYEAELCAETLCDSMRRYRLTRYSELEL